MGLTQFPNGFPNGVAIRGVPILQTNPGQVLWVSSTQGGDGQKATRNAPLATIAKAISLCNAGQGDIVFVMPGHVENVVDNALVPFNVAGVSIIGLGAGASRPTLSYTTANTATIPVSAANMGIQNFIFSAGFLSIAAAFTLSTARNFAIENCLFADQSGVLDFLNIAKSTGAANTVDGLSVAGNKWSSLGTTSMGSWVLSANDIDRFNVSGNESDQASTVDAAILAVISAGSVTAAKFAGNYATRACTTSAAGSLVNVAGTACTGMIRDNYVQTLTTTADLIVPTGKGLRCFNNWASGVADKSGFLVPAADS